MTAHKEPMCTSPPPTNPWKDRTIVMMDVETTGLDWTVDEIIEIGILVGQLRPTEDGFYDLEIADSFQSFLRPRPEAKEGFEVIEELTKISWETVESAPTPDVVAADVDAFLAKYADGIFAAYNVGFDHPFVASLFKASGIAMLKLLRANAPQIDPLHWLRKIDRYVKGTGRHKLMVSAMRHELVTAEESEGAHRADFDALVAMRILARLAHLVPDDLDDLMDWQKVAQGEWAQSFFGKYMPGVRQEERLAKKNAAVGTDIISDALR